MYLKISCDSIICCIATVTNPVDAFVLKIIIIIQDMIMEQIFLISRLKTGVTKRLNECNVKSETYNVFTRDGNTNDTTCDHQLPPCL